MVSTTVEGFVSVILVLFWFGEGVGGIVLRYLENIVGHLCRYLSTTCRLYNILSIRLGSKRHTTDVLFANKRVKVHIANRTNNLFTVFLQRK